jgi:hypothetical protein
MAQTLGGEPEPLDATRVPKRDIFDLAVRLNKEALLKNIPGRSDESFRSEMEELLGSKGADLDLRKFLEEGVGNQVAMHIYDSPQTFGLNVPEFLADVLPMMREADSSYYLLVIPLIVSLNSPVCLSFPVHDANVVDEFLAKLDAALAIQARKSTPLGGFIRFERDFFQTGPHGTRRGHVLRLGPLTWRFFWERIDDRLYIASKANILDDLHATPPAPATTEPTGHAMARVRPENFDAVLPEFQMSWAENNRRACLDNLGPLADAARALQAESNSPSVPMEKIFARAAELTPGRMFCPEGGIYALSPDGKDILCSVHGSPAQPRQPVSTTRPTKELLYGTNGVTATLTFMKDGLHAVMTVNRN